MSLTQELAQRLQNLHWMLSTAESCTGGMIASLCTDLAGSSAWFDRGFVTYSNASKTDMLGVSAELIVTHGAVSETVAKAMAFGAQERSLANTTVAVTGVAGPSGGSPQKPVGTVWIAWCVGGVVDAEQHQFTGDRTSIREAATCCALRGVLSRLPSDTAVQSLG